jgi:mannose-6-phosphate isomerase-like protein (cupin superfamily)
MASSAETKSQGRKIAVRDAMKAIPNGDGRFAEMFRHGSLRVDIYAPRSRDPQQPHTQDEIYVVIQGEGVFVNGDTRQSFGPGDVLFAAAGEVHRFEEFTDDFYTWVFFYGTEGGEK